MVAGRDSALRRRGPSGGRSCDEKEKERKIKEKQADKAKLVWDQSIGKKISAADAASTSWPPRSTDPSRSQSRTSE